MGNRKLGKIVDSVATELSSALNITLLNESGQNSEDYSKLLKELKTKFNASTSFTERKQLLTLAPSSWPRSRVAEEFQCSENIVRESRSINSKFGILPKVTKKKSDNKISEENKLIVASFYEESSRVFPGLKDSITVINKDGVRRKIQKMLLTENISELHYLFQQQYPNIRIGLSKLFELRPRWCIFAGAPGTHNVCVCIYHQNPKLMLEAIDLSVGYKDLLAMLVCSLQNEECMYMQCESSRRCGNCPSPDILTEYLLNNIFEETITYKEWISSDEQGVHMVATTQHIEEYVTKLVGLLQKLASHHLTALRQSAYFKELKQNFSSEECIVMLDFAENYSILIQEEVKSHHWSGKQATLHPFVVYYKTSEGIKNKCYCVLSDYLKHNAQSVHSFLCALIPKLKVLVCNLKKIRFFSDGAGAHYKNKYNFANLSFLQTDFQISAVWNFWASCQRKKNACDGIGGTVKRLFRQHALRGQEIHLEPIDLFNWGVLNIPNVDFLYISSQEIENCYGHLENRFNRSVTVKGTRKFHQYAVLSQGKLKVSILSDQPNSLLSTTAIIVPPNFVPISVSDLKSSDCVAVVFQDKWWITIISEIEEDTDIVNLRFYMPAGSDLIDGSGLKLPRRRKGADEMALSVSEIICKLPPPPRRNRGSKLYDLPNETFVKIVDTFEEFKHWRSDII